MRKLTVFMLASIVVLAGCDMLKKKGDDAGAEAGLAEVLDAAPPGSTTVTASNAAAVARFKTEVPLDEDRVIASTTTPRTIPGGGAVVATLKVGYAVERVATNGKDSLIQFVNPANPNDTLMGWVTDAAFTAAIVQHKKDAGAPDGGAVADAGTVAAVADAGAPAAVADAGSGVTGLQCSPGKTAVTIGTAKPQCKPNCTKNEECKATPKICGTGKDAKGANAKICIND